jgi:hypothetical protein
MNAPARKQKYHGHIYMELPDIEGESPGLGTFALRDRAAGELSG